jgi:hypothetical protein
MSSLDGPISHCCPNDGSGRTDVWVFEWLYWVLYPFFEHKRRFMSKLEPHETIITTRSALATNPAFEQNMTSVVDVEECSLL